MARGIARGLDGRFEVDDLVSAGQIGLLKAARTFDPERGTTFSSYATFLIRGAIISEVRSRAELAHGKYKRAMAIRAVAMENAHEISEGALDAAIKKGSKMSRAEAEKALGNLMESFATAVSLSLVSGAMRLDAETSGAQDLEAEYSKQELIARVREELEKLGETEQLIIDGIYFRVPPRSLSEIAEEQGYHRAWACRLHKKALGRLSLRLRRDGE